MRVLVVAAVCSVFLRVVAVAVAGDLPSGDPQIYAQLAGEGLSRFSPTLGIEVKALHPPLYPLFLSLFMPNVAIANFLIDLSCAGAILWLARACRVPGEFAAALYLVMSAWMSVIPNKEGLAAALVVASAASAIERRAVFLGLFGGLLALTQPALAPLPVMFSLAFVPPRGWPAIAATVFAVMLPWWLRNWVIFGEFVPLTTSSGYSLWIGAFADHEWAALPAHLLVGSELAISRAAAAEAWAWIASNPFAFVVGSLSHALPMAMPFLLVTVLSTGKLRTILILGWLNLFAFQMWFEFGFRHVLPLLPIALLSLASISLPAEWRTRLRLSSP